MLKSYFIQGAKWEKKKAEKRQALKLEKAEGGPAKKTKKQFEEPQMHSDASGPEEEGEESERPVLSSQKKRPWDDATPQTGRGRGRGRGDSRGGSRGRGDSRGGSRGRGDSRGGSRGRGDSRGGSRGRGDSRGSGGFRGGCDGRGGFDQGPLARVLPMGNFTHACQEDLVVTFSINVPYFHATIYLEN